MAHNFTLPPSRIVQGNPYMLSESKDNNGAVKKDAQGNPIKTVYIAVAIKKTVPAGQWWWHEAWGAPIFQAGATDMPNNYQHKAFAWKIEDGDSVEPNKMQKKNCDREGFPGHWIVKCSSTFLPQYATLLDPASPGKPKSLLQENAIKCGDYVEMAITVQGNSRTDSPGIYINPAIVCLIGYGPAISFGMDLEAAGFGKSPAPAGASTTPVGSATTPPAPVASAPAPAAPAAPAPAPAAPAPAPLPVQPHTAITAPPAPAAPAAPVPAAPATVGGSQWNRTAKWPAGVSDADMAGGGWNEQSLRQHGYIV